MMEFLSNINKYTADLIKESKNTYFILKQIGISFPISKLWYSEKMVFDILLLTFKKNEKFFLSLLMSIG